MARLIGLYEQNESHRLFKSILTDTKFFDLNYICFSSEKQSNFARNRTYRILKQRQFIDNLLRTHFKLDQIFINCDGLIDFIHKNDIFNKFSSKTVVYKYINSIYKVVFNYLISGRLSKIDYLLSLLKAASIKLGLSFDDKNIFISTSPNSCLNDTEISIIKDDFQKLKISINRFLELDFSLFKRENFDINSLNKILVNDNCKFVVLKNINIINHIHERPYKRNEKQFISNLCEFLNFGLIKNIPLFLECPRNRSLKLYCLLAQVLKEDEVKESDINQILEIIDD